VEGSLRLRLIATLSSHPTGQASRTAPHRILDMASSSCLASPSGATLCRPRRPRCRVACSAADAGGSTGPAWAKGAGRLACGVLAAWSVASASNPVIAASQVGECPSFLSHIRRFALRSGRNFLELSRFAAQ
jgi:hypothetical protein